MLKRLRLRNFKAWKDTGEIRLAPLTVIFGANSAGKSSLGQLLLALKQTASSLERNQVLNLGDESSLVELGSFVDCIHKRRSDLALEFMLNWKLPEPLGIADGIIGSELQLTSQLIVGANYQPVVQHLEYLLHADETSQFVRAAFNAYEDGQMEIECSPIHLERVPGSDIPLEAPGKFYRLTDRTVARYVNARFWHDFALETERMLASISHLGPLREAPRRLYSWYGATPSGVGAKGELTIACIIAAGMAGRQFSDQHGARAVSFPELVADWLLNLGAIENFKVAPLAPGRNEYEVLVRTLGGLIDVALPDVGFGVSQVLPALVQAFYCPPGSTVWIEQPEIHLHPELQSGLADAFIAAVRACEDNSARHTQLIIETHSEHLLNRLQRRIAEGVIGIDEVAIHFVRTGSEGAELEELVVNEYGEIVNWPDNFFGDEMEDIVARSRAASERRQRGESVSKLVKPSEALYNDIS